MKEFNRLMLQSITKNFTDKNSGKNDAKSDPKSDQVVDTHTSDGNKRKVTATDTTKGKSQHKLLTN